MFTKIRYRLLLSFLLVLMAILTSLGVVVRFLFVHSLSQQVTEKLTTLGHGASSSLESENGQIKFKSDFPQQALVAKDQALEWFDIRGNLISRQGKLVFNLPFAGQDAVQIQSGSPRIQSITLPVVSNDDGKLIGYVRASQSLVEFDEAVRHLDWGMSGGAVVALLLSGIGGLWLTRQFMQPIERNFELLKQFTADASHELRSPLMVISSNAQVALRYPEGIRIGDIAKFEAIADATKQMTRLTEDLLLLARTDNLLKEHYHDVNLNELLTELIEFYRPQAETKSIKLQFLADKPIDTFGDRAQLRRLFANLIANAIQYTLADGRIELDCQITGQRVLTSVRDNGIGLAPDQVDKVFERFWRSENSRTYHAGSFGLGLTIALAIANQHGGEISVTSELGIGSCFTVSLPLLLKS
ncbi:HAMP domain-containing histidine kinase [Pseudanabaena sp. UWO311]|uniref:sensor histidine kinase n=1 Tax=Pseudanabaena sp. UWO311 TaxID=2487337 RepID=UPI001158219A|nr:HAMP domain-containing sensor histidine kinase [Pseudanabaena sp. UWO311]TYQ24648.1 HAMP domain-containing histidine kinase [Pseudanabaena sp. UWO311]